MRAKGKVDKQKETKGVISISTKQRYNCFATYLKSNQSKIQLK